MVAYVDKIPLTTFNHPQFTGGILNRWYHGREKSGINCN
jgi:hypothetical protein